MEAKKIMIVDDNPDILEVITLIMDLEGFKVLAVSNGLLFVESIISFCPDLVLLDVMLGEVDGMDLCNLLKSTKEISHIPVIMISASHGLKNVDFICKPDDFISKPFDINDLVVRVKRQLAA